MPLEAVVLGAIALLYWLMNTMLRPLIAPYAARTDASPELIGFILAMHALPAFALAIPTGLVADRRGHRPLLLAGSALMAGGGLLLTSNDAISVLVASQACIGVGALGVWLAIQGLMISDRGDSSESTKTRDKRISNYSLLVMIGQLAGPTLGGVVTDIFTYRTAFGVFAVGSAMVLGCSLVFRETYGSHVGEDARQSLSARDVGSSYRQAGALMREKGVFLTMLVSFCALYLLDIRTAFQPLYFDSIGISASVIGLLLSGAGACALFARLLLPHMLFRLQTGTVTACCIIPGALAVGGVVLFEDIWALAALSAISGMSLGLAQPLTLVLTAEFTRARERGMGIGLRLMANRTAQWISPFLFGPLLGRFGFGGAFGGTSGALIGLGGVVAWQLNRRSRGQRHGEDSGEKRPDGA